MSSWQQSLTAPPGLVRVSGVLTIHARAFAVMLVAVGLALVAQPAAASGKRIHLADCGGISGGKTAGASLQATLSPVTNASAARQHRR